MLRIRNQQYFLYQLVGGDRFYFVGDKKKEIFTLNDVHPFQVKKQKEFHIKYANCQAGKPNEFGEMHREFKADRKVIFLRNIYDKPQTA